MFKLILLAFIIIFLIILIKYKPVYKVEINNKKVGYIESQEDLDNYIKEIIQNIENNKNIAFIDIQQMPTLKLELADRKIDKQESLIKEEISNQIKLQYMSFAITIDGKEKAYLSTEQEAQEVTDKIKEKYTKDLGILKVYSEDYKQISSVNTKKAISTVSNEIKSQKNNTKTKTNRLIKIAKVNNIKLTRPLNGIITSRYGRRSSPGGFGSTNHKGLDIAARLGSSIYATASGTVTYADYKGALGKLIIINHGNKVETYYGHCSKLCVSNGEKVKAGQKIGTVGKTGSATGYHLHFEIHVRGIPQNPQNYIY